MNPDDDQILVLWRDSRVSNAEAPPCSQHYWEIRVIDSLAVERCVMCGETHPLVLESA